MKKIIEIKTPAKKAQTRKKEVIVCDICGKPDPRTSTYSQMTKCDICRRDIHFRYSNKCSKYYDDTTDYPPYYCIYCYELRYETYHKEMEAIEERAFDETEAILLKIKQQSLEKES